MTTFPIIHNIAFFLLVGNILTCGRSINSSGIRDGIVRSINAFRVSVYCHILRPSPHSVNLFCSVSAIVHLLQEVDGVIFIRYGCAFLGNKSCSTWYYIHHALSETGESLKFFLIRVQSVLDHSFLCAFLGIRPQHVCLLKGLCRVFSYGICGFQSQLLWVCRLLRYCSDNCSRISQVSFSCVGLGVLSCRCHF